MTFLKLRSDSLKFLEAATCLALGYRLLAIGYRQQPLHPGAYYPSP
jgi:hypothetical protein